MVRNKPVARPKVICVLMSFSISIYAKCLPCNNTVTLEVTVGDGREMGQYVKSVSLQVGSLGGYDSLCVISVHG